MEYLAKLASKLLFCVGVMITVVSCVLSSALNSGIGSGPFIGMALMILAVVLWKKSSTQVCPVCAERVQHRARKCKHCGADLAR